MICDQLGEEPDLKEMPITDGDFPYLVQLAFFIYSFLPDTWEGMSGSYLGKNWSSISYLMKLYEVENPKEVIFFMKHYEALVMKYEADKKKKADNKPQIIVPQGVTQPKKK